MPQALVRHVGRQRQRRAPHTGPRGLVQRQDAALRRTQQAPGVVGHTVVVGARPGSHHNATRLGVVYRHVFIASTQHADQRERGQRVDLRGRQADGADGERYPHARAVFSNRGRSLRCIG